MQYSDPRRASGSSDVGAMLILDCSVFRSGHVLASE